MAAVSNSTQTDDDDDTDAGINAAIRAQLENDGLLSLYSSPSCGITTNNSTNEVNVERDATLGVYISISMETDADADSETEPECDGPPQQGRGGIDRG